MYPTLVERKPASNQPTKVPLLEQRQRGGGDQEKGTKVKTSDDAIRRSGWLRHITLLLSVMLLGALFLYGLALITVDAQKQADKLGRIENRLDEFLASLVIFQLRAEKGEPLGYAPLGSDGKIPPIHLPPGEENLLSFLGCWNAFTNDPTLVSSTGEQGTEYSVCTAGSTTLNGEDNWNPFDLVLFVHGLFEWILFEGTTNTIEDVTPLLPGEVSLVDDTLGPYFTMNKWDEGDNVTVTMVNETLVVDGVAEPPPVVTLTGGGVEDPVTDGTGPDLFVKTIEGLGGVSVTSDADTVNVTYTPTPANVDSGSSLLTIVAWTNVLPLATVIPVTFTRVGEIWRVQSAGIITRTVFQGFVFPKADMTFRLSTATNPILAAALHNGPAWTAGVIGGVTILPNPIERVLAGSCVGTALPTDFICTFIRSRSDNDQAFYYNFDFMFREML